MSKLSFRARALDPSKPMPIYLAEELPDLPEYSAINRAVPQMPSGMEKEEESEHHLQRAICTGLIIPTPEVFEATDSEFYERYYSQDYKMPKQLIHMQPLNLEQDVPDYDMDSADEQWITTQGKRLDLDPLKFETMMDRLEKSSGQTVVTLNEAKALLKQDDELSIAVYDYWLNKRLKMQHPLILSVKTESRGNTTPNNPYLAFRRRTEKMQTRKNRKNDESSYEKMLKLRRDLSRAVTLLEMIKRREKIKREQLHLSIEVYEKRYQAQDYTGQMLAEFASNAIKASRPAFAPIYSNQYSSHHGAMAGGGQGVASGSGAGVYGASGSSSQYHGGSSRDKRDGDSHSSSRKEKRQYKKRKHKIQKDRGGTSASGGSGSAAAGVGSSGGVLGRDGSVLAGSAGGSDRYHYQYHPAGGSASGQPLIGGRGPADPSAISGSGGLHGSGTAGDPALSSDDEELANLQGATAPEEEYAYAFRRSKFSQYHRPITKGFGNWPWTSKEENGAADPRYRFTLTSLRLPRPRCIGFARRRVGRGGRVIIDRASTTLDDLWSRLDYKIIESETTCSATTAQEEESVVVSTIPTTTANPTTTATPTPILAAAAVLTTERKRPAPSPVPVGGGAKRRRHQLVIKEETDLDELFLAGVGLVRKRSPSGSTMALEEEEDEQELLERVQVKQEKCGDERTSTPEATVISSLSGGVNNSENNVIKSEVDAAAVEIKQEVLEDYEHMIDNVNNSYRNRISGSGNGINSSSSSSSGGIVNSKNNFIQSFSNSISSNSRGLASRSVQHAAATAASSSGSLQSSSISSRGRQIAEELGLPLDSQAIASVYSDLLEEIQSSWLHFRPKTPEPLPLEDDLLLADDPLFATDANRISLELQTLGEEGLPEEVFTRSAETVFRTRQFALDALVEPHPLGQLATVARTAKDGDELGIKLETCSNSDNNLSGDSLNDLNLSLNESGEDEKMLDKILQECQIDDMKSLNQTSNFWNGILEDGILNQLEVPDEAGGGGAGTGVDVKEELASPPPPVDGAPVGTLSTVNKLGYCSELVGYDRPATVERYKNKRRKILRRCNIQVGSSCFTVRSPPPEEIVRKLSDSAAAPDLENAVLDGTTPVDKADPSSEPAPEAVEVKMEDESNSDSVSATIPSDQIKIEPPDELLAASSSSKPASTTTLIHSHSAPHLQTNTSVMAPFHHSLSVPQIKLEPPLNHNSTSLNQSTATTTTIPPSTSFLIASPSTVQVQLQQAQNSLIQTAQTTIPVVQQQQQQQQQITISSASSSGTSTPTGSYIVQHTTPIVLSQQQMQQIATSGGNIVTVSGNQVITAKQHQQLQQQHGQQIQIQNAGGNAGETYFSLSPIKKQINGPNDKLAAGGAVTVAGAVVGSASSGNTATVTGVDGSPKATQVGTNVYRFAAKQNVIGPRFLINQRIPTGATGNVAGSPTSAKQLEMITKALDIRAQKMIVKSAAAANHGGVVQGQGQGQQQQLTQQLVIHQNSLQQPITIQTSGGGQSVVQAGGQGTTQKQFILTSSPQLMAAAVGSPHGKIAINSIGTAGGDADKNRIVYANIKNSRGQFLAHINHQKVVNIIQPIQQQQQQQQQQQVQQQKLMNNVVGQQQTTQQQLLGAVSAASAATTIVNSKGGGMRIPTVSIRAAQQQQQQQQSGSSVAPDSTTTLANSASIKFIQVTGPAPSSAVVSAADNGAVSTTSTTVAAAAATTQVSAVPASSSSAVGSTAVTTAAAAATAPPTSINITNR